MKGKNVNKIQKIGFGMIGASIVFVVVADALSHYRKSQTEPVDPKLLKELSADRYAQGAVRENIRNAGYTNRPIDPSEDFEFHRIAYHLNH